MPNDTQKIKQIIQTIEYFALAVEFQESKDIGDLMRPYVLFQGNVVMFPHEEPTIVTRENYRKTVHRLVEVVAKMARESKDPLISIMIMISSPYRIQYLHLIKDLLNPKELSEQLGWVWVQTEYPHQYDLKMLTGLFEIADKRSLMNDEELKGLDYMPEMVDVYRGTQSEKAKVRGMAWTLDKDKAIWFANRWKTLRGKVYRATIPKTAIYAYFKGRNEEEIVLNPRRLRNVRPLEEV